MIPSQQVKLKRFLKANGLKLHNSKKRSLYFHIGLPKTGSTSLQESLKAHKFLLNDIGIGGQTDNGDWSHHELAEILNNLELNTAIKKEKLINSEEIVEDKAPIIGLIDDLQTPGYIKRSDESRAKFPSFQDYNSLLISSEAFSGIGDAGAQEVIKFTKKNDAQLKIIGIIRSLDEWLWSMWSQYTKSHWIDWCDYIVSAEFNKVGFLSSAFAPWLRIGTDSIKIINYSKTDTLNDFFKSINLTQDIINNISSGSKTRLNERRDIVSTMYQAANSKLVLENINESLCFNFHKPNPGFAIKMLRDISEIGTPAFEISSIFEKKILIEKDILGIDYVPYLKKYISSWIEDAYLFLNSSNRWIDDNSRTAITLAINSNKAILENPILKPLPNHNFISKLPLNSQFIGQARVISSCIVIASREIN
jgi:hypothetical protein